MRWTKTASFRVKSECPKGRKEKKKEKNMRKQFFSFFLALCQKKEGEGRIGFMGVKAYSVGTI